MYNSFLDTTRELGEKAMFDWLVDQRDELHLLEMESELLTRSKRDFSAFHEEPYCLIKHQDMVMLCSKNQRLCQIRYSQAIHIKTSLPIMCILDGNDIPEEFFNIIFYPQEV